MPRQVEANRGSSCYNLYMSDKRTYTIPPQDSAEDTTNWDDRAFAILRPATKLEDEPVTRQAVMNIVDWEDTVIGEETDEKH